MGVWLCGSAAANRGFEVVLEHSNVAHGSRYQEVSLSAY